MPISWDQVGGQKILEAASAMLDKWKARPQTGADVQPGAEAVEPYAEIRQQLAMALQRLQALEEEKAAQSEMAKSLMERIKQLDEAAAAQAQAAQGIIKKVQAVEDAATGKVEALDRAARQVQELAASLSRSEKKTTLALLLAGIALAASVAAIFVSVIWPAL
jgi:DNA repair exonuclease SbcCD ATPase subunit